MSIFPSLSGLKDTFPELAANGFVQENDVLSHHYSFHGISLCISSNQPQLLNLLQRSLQHFRTRKKPSSLPSLHLAFFSYPDPTQLPFFPQPQMKPVSSSDQLKYFSKGRRLFTTLADKALVMCQLDQNQAVGFFHPSLLTDSWTLHQLIFYPPFAELLKQQHIFNVHGALVANRTGSAVLITGPTGRGKSTTMVNLVNAGYQFLADDISLIKQTGSELLFLAFPEPVNLYPNILANFPELKQLNEAPAGGCLKTKRSFYIDEVYPGCLRLRAHPAWIVFPQVQADGPTSLTALGKKEALSQLIPQSLVVANKAIVEEHLQVLTQLVETCQCFSLQLGKQAQQKIPRLFADLK